MTSGGIFTVQFNTNACLLEGYENGIFQGASNASVVICSFQEYDLAPVEMVPPEPVVLLTNEHSAEPSPLTRGSYLRHRGSDAVESEDARMSLIQSAIGPSFRVVTDVSMGEPAGLIQEDDKVNNKKKLEWYGFIRLIIWARADLENGAKLCRALDEGSVKTCVVPCGDKATGNPTKEDALLDDPDAPYMKGMSPDKGAVCAYFPSAKLIVVAAHLHGTNKPLPEATFNVIREQQLKRIGQAVTWLVNQFSEGRSGNELGESVESQHAATRKEFVKDAANLEATLFIIGDLNFRVESEFTEPEDKDKGGKDFSAIEKLASSNNKKDLSQLMENNDILYQLLRSRADEIPPILVGCRDAVAETILRQKVLLPPTFTFKQDAPYPREYKNKRTPSWPDRILFRDLNYFMSEPITATASIVAEWGGGGESTMEGGYSRPSIAGLRYCHSLREIVCSDHEAVVAFFDHGEPSQINKLWLAFDGVVGQMASLFSSEHW